MSDTRTEKIEPLLDVLHTINAYGSRLGPLSCSQEVDLVRELEARTDSSVDADAARSLRDKTQWSDELGCAVRRVIRACEDAGIPFEIRYEHVEGTTGPVILDPVILSLRGR